jgi:hypothetical protein
MLHPLPFITFGEVADVGLEIEVRCAGCNHQVNINPANEQLRNRRFAACPCSKVQEAMGSVCRRSVRQTLLDHSTKALTAPAT